MTQMLVANNGEVRVVEFKEGLLEDIFSMPLLSQFLITEPTLISFMLYISEQRKDGYSRDDMIDFADDYFYSKKFRYTPPIYDPVLDAERSLEMLSSCGIITEKGHEYGYDEPRYFLMPVLADFLGDLREDFMKPKNFCESWDFYGRLTSRLLMKDGYFETKNA